MLPSGSPKDSNEQYKKSNAPLSFPSDGSAILISGFALAAGEIIAQRGETALPVYGVLPPSASRIAADNRQNLAGDVA